MSSLQLPSFQIQEIIHCKRRNSTIKTENKSCCVLSCRISGESLFSDSTGSHPVRRGDVLYIPIGASYTQECASEEIIGFHLTVSGAVSDRIEVRTCTDPDRICALFLRAHMLWSQKAPNYTYMCMAILYEILALSSAGLCADPPMPDDVLAPAMEICRPISTMQTSRCRRPVHARTSAAPTLTVSSPHAITVRRFPGSPPDESNAPDRCCSPAVTPMQRLPVSAATGM